MPEQCVFVLGLAALQFVCLIRNTSVWHMRPSRVPETLMITPSWHGYGILTIQTTICFIVESFALHEFSYTSG